MNEVDVPRWVNRSSAVKMLIEIEREHQGNEASSKTDQEILDEVLDRRDEQSMNDVGL